MCGWLCASGAAILDVPGYLGASDAHSADLGHSCASGACSTFIREPLGACSLLTVVFDGCSAAAFVDVTLVVITANSYVHDNGCIAFATAVSDFDCFLARAALAVGSIVPAVAACGLSCALACAVLAAGSAALTVPA
ncbi:MAG: hypothetical protein CMJ52_09225 [Planctomycetaceae bacterium]|nr:hypothetical protein [Planctomycetaceae bacterium]